ncbi:MAG: hypothetical protein QNI84_12440 [Henriciella sp.]|nr:hypothetical protein [Henriciella sp.]
MTAALPMIGHKGPEAQFIKARESARLHHGWLVQGPSGIGKSLFVKRLAALMLGAASPDADMSDPTMQKVLSGSHPDLKWVERGLNEKGQLRQDITVDQIRDLNGFFALRPALSGWRVGVIDALDEANVAGLNALLKTLEEPPSNAILFLISHGTKTVLPTIRSRCQTLRLSRLSDEETTSVLALMQPDEAIDLDLVKGRPGLGVELAKSGTSAAAQATKTLLRSIRKPTGSLVSAALQAASKDKASLDVFMSTMMTWTAEQALEQTDLGETWLELHQVRSMSDELNLTPLQTATKALTVLQNDLKALASTP